jgi:hypothetical protein
MCSSGHPAPPAATAPAACRPATSAEAMAALEAAYGFLAGADVGSMPAAEKAEWLRVLERTEARHTAARSTVLTGFAAQGDYLDDGQQSPRAWLRWQTRVTLGAASAAARWARRLAAHPAVAAALAATAITVSWAEKVCGWTDRLPEEHRAGADQILLGAAARGADLDDLAALAEQIYQRTAGPDTDDDRGFTDRSVRLDRTFGGGGSLTGSLTPACAAAVEAWLESFSKKLGPEDTRTLAQRTHDALEEGARRLVTTGTLPDRAGQPAQVQLLIPFDRLRNLPGADAAMAEWAAKAAADGRPGWLLDRAAAEGYACDAMIAPVVTGQVDLAALAQLTTSYLDRLRRTHRWHPGATWPPPPLDMPAGPLAPGPALGALPPKTMRRLQNTLLAQAADVLSGPTGLAAFLRTRLLATDYPPMISRALDIGADTGTVPPYMRRALVLRDKHCAAPGCRRKPIDCHAHHIIPRSQGGATALHNLLLLCAFHHLVMIHRWGWTITLNTDGTTTMTSPDGKRILHSHGPPTPSTA